ncbi:hypothetical protein MKX03_030328 [Papaver bracteatum]|nr:hypothetical protein MKX03_030328 [Papaver bracteatum]
MANNSKLVLIFMVLVLVAISMFQIQVLSSKDGNDYVSDGRNYGEGSLTPTHLCFAECEPECQRRCGDTKYEKPCLFFCRKCCKTCLCVPPGFYWNKEVCPCYNNWKTQQGGHKCP